jgi:hypothetical protein
MSLIRWQGGDDDIQTLVKRSRNLLDTKELTIGARELQRGIEILTLLPVPASEPIYRPRAGAAGAGFLSAFPVAMVDHPPVLELPRWCSIHDGELSLARYLRRNGVYVYDENIEMTPAQKRRYSADNAVPVPADFCPARECCACCGKWTPAYAVGAISCSRCNPIAVCFGNTSPDRYFECRASCGQRGFLTNNGFDRVALVPGSMRGNFSAR